MLKLKSVILLFVFSIFPVSIFYSPVSYLNFLGLHIDLFVTFLRISLCIILLVVVLILIHKCNSSQFTGVNILPPQAECRNFKYLYSPDFKT